MRPNKKGQIAKFHTPLEDENPNEIYVVLEVMEDTEKPRAEIKALNTGLSFPPINTVLLEDLEVIELKTLDLIGNCVIINNADNIQVKGTVIKIKNEKINLALTEEADGVQTNVWLTINDENGKEHTGTLFVN